MSTKKNQILKFLKAIMVLCFGALFVFVIVRSNFRQSDNICKDVKVKVKDQKTLKFITETDVKEMLNKIEKGAVENKKVSEIDIEKIEFELEKNDFIDNAEVYFNFEGSLQIDIVQKKPLYRIINNKNVSYYISEKAYRVPLSSNFTPRLIVATGYIPEVEDISSDKVNNNLNQLIRYIQADPFWEAMFGHIEVRSNGDFVLTPKLKGHTVMLGGIEDLDSKLSKLKIFYKQALKKTDWNKYKEINLKFKGQLICSK